MKTRNNCSTIARKLFEKGDGFSLVGSQSALMTRGQHAVIEIDALRIEPIVSGQFQPLASTAAEINGGGGSCQSPSEAL